MTNAEGEWHLSAMGNPEDGAQIMAALGPLTEEAFERARREQHHEHPDAYRFDALVHLAVNATSEPNAKDGDNEPAPQSDRPPGSEADPPAPFGDTYDTDRGAGQETEPASATTATATSERLRRSRTGIPARGDRRSPATRGARNTRARWGAPVRLLLRVDLDTFLRGFPTDGETCDLVGHGPISMSAVHDILKDGDPFIAAVLTKGRQVLGVAHLGRKPTAFQKTVLEWIYPTCAAAGCPSSARLEKDHRHDWASTYVTLIDWLDALCHHHHSLKTKDGWALVDGIGKRPFVAPTDPRHPKYQPPPEG